MMLEKADWERHQTSKVIASPSTTPLDKSACLSCPVALEEQSASLRPEMQEEMMLDKEGKSQANGLDTVQESASSGSATPHASGAHTLH